MRALGAVLILAASLLLATLWQLGKKRRLACLTSLLSALHRLEAELSGRNALPALAASLAAEDGEAGAFFSSLSNKLKDLGERSFCLLWAEAAEEALVSLTAAEKRSIIELGAVLGRRPLDMQLLSVSRCRSLFEEQLERTRLSLSSDARMVLGLSLSSGLMLLIVLL